MRQIEAASGEPRQRQVTEHEERVAPAASRPSAIVLRGGSVAAETVTGATSRNTNGFSMPPVR